MSAGLSESYRQLADEYRKHLMGDIELNASEREELRWRRVNYYVFAFFVVLIGLPIWYLTTTPHRARLPYFGDEYRTRIQEFLDEQNVAKTTSGDVWLQTTLSPRYNIHVIFVHATAYEYDDGDSVVTNLNAAGEKAEPAVVRQILGGIEKFARVFAGSIRSDLSAEHFFDFSLAGFLAANAPKQSHRLLGVAGSEQRVLTVEAERVSALTAQIDALSTPPLTSSDPLVKIVVFVPPRDAAVRFLDAEKKLTNGLAVASWGGFVALPTQANHNSPSSSPAAGIGDCLGAIFGLLRLQLGIVAARERMRDSPVAALAIAECDSRARAAGRSECGAPERDAIYHKILATAENLAQIVHLVDSLHDLGAKIEDLVISEEVAKLADAAHENFFRVYDALIGRQKLDFEPSASLNARVFAETAITHPSLLEYLNFPSDQKYGIYVPLFFPVLVPLLFPIANLAVFVVRKKIRRAKKPTQAAEANNEKEATSAGNDDGKATESVA